MRRLGRTRRTERTQSDPKVEFLSWEPRSRADSLIRSSLPSRRGSPDEPAPLLIHASMQTSTSLPTTGTQKRSRASLKR